MISLPLLPNAVWGHFPKVWGNPWLVAQHTHTHLLSRCYSNTFNSKSAVSSPRHGETCRDTWWVSMCNKGLNMQEYLNTSYQLHHLLLEVSRHTHMLAYSWLNTHTLTLYSLMSSLGLLSLEESKFTRGGIRKGTTEFLNIFGWLTSYSYKLSNTKPTHIT